ncbi:MAG: hypothetical protein O7F71_17515 [Gammaproteobacteria bacterium]|nr:hypothetical protein [Gammaproteobacteria bacterium]
MTLEKASDQVACSFSTRADDLFVLRFCHHNSGALPAGVLEKAIQLPAGLKNGLKAFFVPAMSMGRWSSTITRW